MRQSTLYVLMVVGALTLIGIASDAYAQAGKESADKYFERNVRLKDDGTGKMPLFGPERMCKMLKKGDPRCPMSTDAFCAIIYKSIANGTRKSVHGTVCPPKAQ